MFTQEQEFGARTLLRDTARDRIRAEILSGELAPGTLLDDAELARRLHCSRTPVREALADLERGGLVERRANRYTRVAVPRAADLVPALQALGLLYGGLVRISVPRLSAGQRSAVTRQIETMLDVLHVGGWHATVQAAPPVYRTLIESCDNPMLCGALRGSVDALTFRLRHESSPAALPWERIRDGLLALRRAVGRGDGRLAERAMWAVHLLPDPDGDD